MSWNEAILATLASHGRECLIGHQTFLLNPDKVYLGNRVRIDPFTLITTGLHTGDNVRICTHVVLSGGGISTIRMGDWSFIAYGSKIFCGSEDYTGDYGPVNEYWGSNKVYQGDVTIGHYAGIFSDVILMPGVSIPEGCYIAARSVVRSNDILEPWNVYAGDPLRTKFPRPRNREAVLRLARDPAFLKHPIAV